MFALLENARFWIMVIAGNMEGFFIQKISLIKGVMEKMTVCLLLVSLLWGCGQSGGNIKNERPDESSMQADEAVQTEEIFDDSIIFTDATMEEIISEACKGKPDKEHLEAITVLHLSLTKGEEPIVVLDDLALLSNLEQLYIDVQPGCEKQMVLDYGYLENMEELAELTIHDEHLTDISFIKQMKTLQRLDVSDCSIKDISHLLSCSSLRDLNLSNNEIEDYTGIEYLPELDNLIIGGNPGDPLQVLRKRAADVFTTSDEDREAWKDELEKAFDVYDPLIEKSDEFNSETEDWCVGDFNGDGIDDLGVVVGRTDEEIASVPIQRRLYLYLGNEEGYGKPLNPLPLRSGYGNENSFQGFTMRDGKVFAKYCLDSQDTLLTDMEIYEYRDEEWQYVLYTSDQKQSTGKESQEAADSIIRRVNCFGVYDFENDSFTVYTWRHATDDKGEYVKRWGHSLSDVFLYYDRIRYDEGEDGYKWISIVNPYYLYPDVSLETVKGQRKEISENENAISTGQALDMIYEQYYGTYSCDKIFFDEDVLAVYEDVLGCEMPEYAYRIEIDGIPYFLHLSQVDETVYGFYTYGFDYDKKEMVRVDTFQVNSLTGVIDAYLDI